MTAASPSRRNVIAVLVATTAALMFRAWLEVELLEDGFQKDYAADLSYLVVPPILILLLFPVLRLDRRFLAAQFELSRLSAGLVLRAILVGVAIRGLWWAQLIAGVSLGIYHNPDLQAVEGPVFVFDCPAPRVVLLGLLVMTMAVPFVEEITHRAYVQTSLGRFGAWVAIPVSALLFSVFHLPSSWGFVFLAGIVFGVQYWYAASLWPALITHATVNTLIQLDWRCLNGQWNPRPETLPLWCGAAIASLAAFCFLIMIVSLVRPKK